MWNKIISVDQPAVPIPKSLLNTAYGHTDPSIKGDVNKHSTVRKITGLSMESPQPCGHNLLPWPHRGCVQHCPLKAGKLKSCTVSAEKPQNPSTSDPWKKGGQEHCTSSGISTLITRAETQTHAMTHKISAFPKILSISDSVCCKLGLWPSLILFHPSEISPVQHLQKAICRIRKVSWICFSPLI